MNKTDLLRSLPAVDEVLRSEALAELRTSQPHGRLAEWVRAAIDRVRRQILEGADSKGPEFSSPDESSALQSIIDLVRESAAADHGQSIQRVINATGIVLHTNLGRAPLAEAAIDRMEQAARYANVELDLGSGRRCSRGARVMTLLARLAGSEQALVVNNCAAATMLVLQTLARDREVIVSRGQLVEIGGGFRLPDVFRAAGVVLREVGTTNRTYLRDYESAISEQTGAIIRVHRSNFALSGFVTEPTIDELVSIPRSDDVPVIDDLGSGCMEDLSSLGLSEPTVAASARSGADLTLFSGDKLFGGPQCGIIVGRSAWVDKLRKSPMMRAMRVDKMTLAALEATTEIHLSGDAMQILPSLRMLSAQAETIRERCEQVFMRIRELCDAKVVPCESQVGGGSVPGAVMASHAIQISCPHADRLAKRLRSGSPAIQSRVSDDCVLLDLRTVADDELESLACGLARALQTSEDGQA